MQRRDFIQNSLGLGIAFSPLIKEWKQVAANSTKRDWKIAGPQKPVFIYNNWSAYDELSDNVPQTESLAMFELQEIVRLKKNGVKMEYYVMDAFWFDKDGGYRKWHQEHWPNGPDKWLAACKDNHLKPGMWFSTNLVTMGGKEALAIIPEWKDSVGTDPNILCLFEGGYLSHLAETLQIWYDKGVRLFKFDFAYFEAATAAAKAKYSVEEIIEKNKVAFMNMLQQFRKKNPDILITAYNGFGGDMENTFTPFTRIIDSRWLDCFDTMYCGDPRFSDVPMLNIWRSSDNYSDHQVKAFEAYGLPLQRIDNCAFMIGKTGTCYRRGNHCWKGMLILELARGGWVNVYHGNLELLSDEDAKWFAKTQSMYHLLQLDGRCSLFGEIPGKGKPYGFKSVTVNGMVCTVVNPSQEITVIELPAGENLKGRILYADGGYQPSVKGNQLVLGAEQLAVVGFDEFAGEKYELGTDETIRIPIHITRIETHFIQTQKNSIEASAKIAKDKDVRIFLQQFDSSNVPHRSWPWENGSGKEKKISEQIIIKVQQEGKNVPTHIEYDKLIWSGLSWAAAEIHHTDFNPDKPLFIRCTSSEKMDLTLKAALYEVKYY